MATIEPIKVEGLTEFRKALRDLDGDLPKALRIGLNDAAEIVASAARRKVPRRSGRAANSIKVRSTASAVRVVGGGGRIEYYPWLEFGGTVGKGRLSQTELSFTRSRSGRVRVSSSTRRAAGTGSVHRPFRKGGRYIWLSLGEKREEVLAAVEAAVIDVAKQAGLEVTSNG